MIFIKIMIQFLLILLFFLITTTVKALLTPPQSFKPPGEILLMDHFNINHEAGRHDLLKEFYFETLGLAIDPRKEENIVKNKKGVWANAGITQFHLSEGKTAQVLDGEITIAYPSGTFQHLRNKLQLASKGILKESKYDFTCVSPEEYIVTDMWGSKFRLVADDSAVDDRGIQPGPPSKGSLIQDLNFNVPYDASLKGIARYYEYIFKAPIFELNDKNVKISMSPFQTLTFTRGTKTNHDHSELEVDEKSGNVIANHGAHISLYVRDLPACYQRAKELGSIFVNKRFKRQAYTLDEAIDQCMFRVIDIVDPLDKESQTIVRLEHEVRSIVNKDGTKYKSCPLYQDVVDLIMNPPPFPVM